MARKNTLTRFLEDIIDDSKDLIDDLIDRAKDVEENAKDAVVDVVDDDEKSDGPSPTELSALQASLADLTAKVSELAAIQQQSSPTRAKTTTSS
jgi:polyhydroxyalkanoate synthesis regulator phasin